MAFLTNEKLTIVGAAGMIGSNMAQTALMMGLTSNLCLYDVFSPEGVAEEMRQCGFDGVNITATTDVKEAFTDAKYIISSGGAPRKAGMTREDLLKGNCEIAEQHGVTMSAGMAAEGLKPVFAVYSTFLQRGYDQLLHDVCLQKLPVVFGIDRAGLVGADGETHQGVYDIAYFSTLPRGIKLFSPSSTNELCAMLDYALTLDMPCAIRYNRGLLPSRECSHGTSLEDWEIIKRPKCVTVAATGRLLQNAAAACEGLDVGLVNARLLCPIEEKHIELFENTRCLITVEDGNADTGFGAQMSRLAAAHGKMRVVNLGVPNIPIEAASIAEQDDFCGLTTEKLRKVILEAVESVRGD